MPSPHVDFQSRVGAGAQQLDVAWTAERAERVRVGIVQRHQAVMRRRKLLRAGGLATLFLAALWLPRVGWLRPGLPTEPQTLVRGVSTSSDAEAGHAEAARKVAPMVSAAEASRSSSLRLADGCSARPRDNSAVAVREESASRILVELLRGGAEFVVPPSADRLFRVAAGDVFVESSESQFSVDKQPVGESDAQTLRVAVAVTAGRVRVLWVGQQAVLVAGERVEFQVTERTHDFSPSAGQGRLAPVPAPAESATIASARAALSVAGKPAVGASRSAGSTTVKVGWRQLARSGDFEQAYQQAFGPARPASTRSHSLRPADVVLSPLLPARPDPADLLLLADVARMSQHPASAVAPLRRLLDQYGEDPRAPLAAFTLGRVLLDDMGQPREAAESFQRTQALDAEGPLSHDALAREVEAWSRAGDLSRARERAREYIRRYPSGRRMAAVRRLADLPAASATTSGPVTGPGSGLE